MTDSRARQPIVRSPGAGRSRGGRPRHQLPVYSPLDVTGGLRELRGDPIRRLEGCLRGEYDVSDVLLFGSGTDALTAAMPAVGASRSDRPVVALPAYGCFDLATAALGARALVRFYDLDPLTLGPDWSSLESVVAAGVDAVVVAPLYGIPIEWDRVLDVLGAEGPVLIEDAAQAFGARWNDRPLGGLGDLSVLSFGRGKGWTGGGGGALLSGTGIPRAPGPLATPGLPTTLRTAAVVLAQRVLGRPTLYGLPSRLPFTRLGETTFQPPRDPRCITRLSAALALASREASHGEAAQRRRNVGRLLDRLAEALGPSPDADLFVPAPPPGSTPGWLRLPLLTRAGTSGMSRDVRRLGIMPGYPCILPELEGMDAVTVGPMDVPGATGLTRRLVTLPTHSLLTDQDMEEIVYAVAPSLDPR